MVNCTYAGTNGVLTTFGLDPVPLKCELCEVALVDALEHARTGVTVLHGLFFSLMPFGHAGLHSLTAVDYTPHTTSTDVLPTFRCQPNTDSVAAPHRHRHEPPRWATRRKGVPVSGVAGSVTAVMLCTVIRAASGRSAAAGAEAPS